jgi:hypothetical protein
MNMPTINVRHRSASGSFGASIWELDESGNVVAYVRFDGMRPIGCTLSVCSSRRPVVGALSLTRVDETTWKIMPARYRHGGGFWSTVTSAFEADALLPLWPMMLTHCHADAAKILEVM